jgi:hypothetical protein
MVGGAKGTFQTIKEKYYGMTYEERLEHPCEIWSHGTNDRGYGKCSNPETKKTTYAHRYTLEMLDGPAPEGKNVACHGPCNNKLCLIHIRWGDGRDNFMDQYRDGTFNPIKTGFGKLHKIEHRKQDPEIHHCETCNHKIKPPEKPRRKTGIPPDKQVLIIELLYRSVSPYTLSKIFDIKEHVIYNFFKNIQPSTPQREEEYKKHLENPELTPEDHIFNIADKIELPKYREAIWKQLTETQLAGIETLAGDGFSSTKIAESLGVETKFIVSYFKEIRDRKILSPSEM